MPLTITGQKIEMNVPYSEVVYMPLENVYLVKVYMICEDAETKRQFKRGFAIKIAAEKMFDIAEGCEFPVVSDYLELNRWEQLIEDIEDE